MYKWFVNLHLHTAEQHPIPSTTSPTLKLSLSDGTTKFSQLSTLSNTVTSGSPNPSMTPTQPTRMSTMEAPHIIEIAVPTGLGGLIIVLGCVGGAAIVCWIKRNQHKPVRGKNRGMNCILKIVQSSYHSLCAVLCGNLYI